MHVGRLLFPALRSRPGSGFAHCEPLIERALEIGAGGFILFGGTARGVAELTAELRRRSRVPLLIAADLERGAGQQFEGATPLPPLAGIGALDDLDVTRGAAALTAREARALGVNWVYAPIADIDIEPENPIIGTRAFGAKPEIVARHVAAWIEGCRSERVLACAKHFPGHGRTLEDSHTTLPRVSAGRSALDADLLPFRAAIAAGVDSIMTAHVRYDAYDAARPATLSPAIISGLLRGELGFNGLVVSDALNMAGAVATAGSEAGAAVAALAAGCDALLHPTELEAVAEHLEAAPAAVLPPTRLKEALARISVAAASADAFGVADDAPAAAAGRVGDAATWAGKLAVRTIIVVRGSRSPVTSLDLMIVDDDSGGPYPPPARAELPARLRERGIDVHETGAATRSGRPLFVAVFADIRAWKGRPGLSAAALRRIEHAVAGCPGTTVLLFGHPRLASELTLERVFCAWGGEPVMQRAMADWIAERAGG